MCIFHTRMWNVLSRTHGKGQLPKSVVEKLSVTLHPCTQKLCSVDIYIKLMCVCHCLMWVHELDEHNLVSRSEPYLCRAKYCMLDFLMQVPSWNSQLHRLLVLARYKFCFSSDYLRRKLLDRESKQTRLCNFRQLRRKYFSGSPTSLHCHY
jgi:hypothetical protein